MATDNSNRVGGITGLVIDGTQYSPKGDFTWNPGIPNREEVIGTNEIAGYKETPVAAFFEGAITYKRGVDIKALGNTTNSTAMLNLPNGESVVFRNAWFSGALDVTTAEGEAKIKFVSPREAEIIS